MPARTSAFSELIKTLQKEGVMYVSLQALYQLVKVK
jgi:hypothetical protein